MSGDMSFYPVVYRKQDINGRKLTRDARACELRNAMGWSIRHVTPMKDSHIRGKGNGSALIRRTPMWRWDLFDETGHLIGSEPTLAGATECFTRAFVGGVE